MASNIPNAAAANVAAEERLAVPTSTFGMAKWPRNSFAGSYGHPMHPALVVVPIGAWTMSLVFDIASNTMRDASYLVRGSRMLMGIGVASAPFVAAFGYMDYLGIPENTKAKSTAKTHMMLNLSGAAAYAVNWYMRNPMELHVSRPFLLASAATYAVLNVSAFLGGKMAYTYGVRVADEYTQAQAFERRK